MQVLEDGGLKLTLSNTSEVDLYMLQMMKQISFALPCMQKKRAKTIFLYESFEWIRLRKMLELFEFEETEALKFLIALFQALQMMEKEYPIYVTLDSVYYDLKLAEFHCVVLPIHHRAYENDWGVFMKDLLELLMLHEGHALLGRLYQLTKCKIDHAEMVMDALICYQRHRKIIERIKRKLRQDTTWKQQRKQRLQSELAAQKLLRRNSQEESITSSDTVVLFSNTSHAYITKDGKKIALTEKNILGRNQTCTIPLHEATVSAYHAQILQQQQGFVLVDLSSKNGTRLNDKPIAPQKEYILHDNDVIQLAEVTLIYKEEL